MTMLTPFARPLYVMPKPVGSLCNLACAYCYYLEKSLLYETEDAQRRFLMSDETLETFIRQYIEAQTQPQVLFTWHGGEPLMRPLSFYRKVLQLQRRYAGGRLIDNCLQTNGTLLTDEWCSFFREHNWLIGISIDGPQELHDKYRRARGGQPSFHKVMRGIRLLQKHGVEWNVMGVVNSFNADCPLDVYHFYKSIGAHYIQFTPIVERLLSHPDGRHLASVADTSPAPLASFSVSPRQYADFVCRLFDEWVRQDVGEVYVQLFDAALARWMGLAPGICAMAEKEEHILGVSLSRNRGHQNAVLAGLMEAKDRCDITISIDCDGQDDLDAMDRMVDAYLAGSEVVYGVRSSRETDTFFKRTTAQGFYKFLSAMGAEVVYNHADYRLVSSRVLQHFADFEEVNLFLRGMIPLVGFPSTTVEYARHERMAGESKYPLRKMLALAMNGITSLSVRPLHLITSFGVFVAIVSFIGCIWALVSALVGKTVAGWASMTCIICFVSGVQLISLGIIGEYIGKVYMETKHRPRYIISERTWEK